MTFSDFSIRDFYNTAQPPTELALSLVNPIIAPVYWDGLVAEIRNERMQEWVQREPTGALPDRYTPITFDVDFTKFLLMVMEMPYAPHPGPYWWGPYLVEIPSPGVYAWDSTNGKIDGIQAVNLPLTDNESEVVGVVASWDWLAENAWALYLDLESSTPVPGKEDVAKYFIGKTLNIQQAGYPADSLGNPLVPAGERIVCKLQMLRYGYSFGWKAWDMHYPRQYPDSAYQFTGSVEQSDPYEGELYDPEFGWYTETLVDFVCTVSGNVEPFSAAFVSLGMYGPIGVQHETGPCTVTITATYDDIQFGYFRGVAIYGHPSPDAPAWDQYSWQLNNWVRVC